MGKKVVGVLRGGKKGNYEKSLEDGGVMISHIFENLNDKWKVVDIFIDKNDVWHLGGLPIIPAYLNSKVDVVWNVAHPSYSKILRDLSVPCVGTDYFPKILESRKILENHMKDIGIRIPRYILIPAYQEDFDGKIEDFLVKKAKEVHSKFASPWVVKTLNHDSNIAVHVAKTFPELIDAIYDCARSRDSILIEELVSGRNFSVHLVPGFRKEKIYCFPIIEKKYQNIIRLGKFLADEKEKITESAKKIFYHANADKYLRVDFTLHPRQGIYLTHIEFSPNLDSGSCFYHACESVGVGPHDIIDHILEGF